MSVYEYSEEETRLISAQVFAITVLGGIRSEGAGRVRSKSWGAEYLEFGPNRSAHRDDVGRAIEALLDIARRRGADLTAASDVADSVQLAVWLHAEVIRIHPFFDGNGRTSRYGG